LLQEQTVSEMVEEVLEDQAMILVERTGQPLEDALEAVSVTNAGRQLRELAQGSHCDEKADEWQESLLRERADKRLRDFLGSDTVPRFAVERHYSWVENYMEWLEGKEARPEYHALLEEELASLRG
jgi:hypothetical protein